jgi:DNA-binding CsgD family transcriptional regulator
LAVKRLGFGTGSAIAIALLLALAASYFSVRPRAAEAGTLAHSGIIDLAGASLDDAGIVPLGGEWEYYRNSDIVSGTAAIEYATLPHVWEDSRYGFATYRLSIKGLIPGREYALKVPYLSTAFALYLDGDKIAQNGEPGASELESSPEYNPSIAEFTASAATARLTLRVSNFFHRRGGPFQTILLGEKSAILEYDFWSVFIDGTLTIIFLISGLYQIPFFVLRKSISNLWLGLFFLGLGAVMLFETPEVLIMGLFPRMDWFAFERLDYGFIYLLPVWVALFMHSMFGGVSRRTLSAFAAPALAIVLFVCVTPPGLFTRYNLLFQLYSVFLYSASLLISIRAVRDGKTGSRAVLIGFCIFAASILSNNILSGSPFPAGNYLPLSFLKAFATAGETGGMYGFLDIVSWLLIFIFIMISSLSFTFSYPIRLSLRDDQVGDDDRIAGKATDAGLSERERDVARLILRGKDNKEIAQELFISLSTVKTHVSRIFRKTGAKSRAGLFYYFQGDHAESYR